MRNNKKSFTTAEMLVSALVITMIFACTVGAFLLVKKVFLQRVSEISLQEAADNIVAKIARGRPESGVMSGLRSAASFTIPTATPAGSRIDYVGSDGVSRSYFLNGNTVQYLSPRQSPTQQAVYSNTVSGASIALIFYEPTTLLDGSANLDHETVGVYFAISQPSGNKTITGSASTYMNLRNIQK